MEKRVELESMVSLVISLRSICGRQRPRRRCVRRDFVRSHRNLNKLRKRHIVLVVHGTHLGLQSTELRTTDSSTPSLLDPDELYMQGIAELIRSKTGESAF
jgi:hypothetical protein